MKEIQDFVNYVLLFYAKGEIYDMGATKEEALFATGIRMERMKWTAFFGYTIDRELVRDIILELRG
jgi:hypothetical protein